MNHATLRPHFSWHFAQHYVSSIRWLHGAVGETRPWCASKQVLRPLLRITSAPFRYATSVPQIGRISQEDAGKGRVIYTTAKYHHCYTWSYTTGEMGCSVSTECHLQIREVSQKETWHQLKHVAWRALSTYRPVWEKQISHCAIRNSLWQRESFISV